VNNRVDAGRFVDAASCGCEKWKLQPFDERWSGLGGTIGQDYLRLSWEGDGKLLSSPNQKREIMDHCGNQIKEKRTRSAVATHLLLSNRKMEII
jgi:hypothetical protein